MRFQPADSRDAVEHPGPSSAWLRNLALVEDDCSSWINAAGDEGGRDLARVVAQFQRILRHGDRVQIDDAIEQS